MIVADKMNAKEVLSKYWDGSVPVRPIAIANKMGVKVFRQSGIAESGRIFLDEDTGKPKLVFNDDEAEVRQRFTIAHELGHFALGHLRSDRSRLFRDTRKELMSNVRDPKEVEANRFAARLLMPADAVRLAVKNGARSIPELAQLFHVSEVAMKFRLMNLGMLRG